MRLVLYYTPSELPKSSTLWRHSKKSVIWGKDLICWSPDLGLNLQKHAKFLFISYLVYVFLLQQGRLAVVFSSSESSVAEAKRSVPTCFPRKSANGTLTIPLESSFRSQHPTHHWVHLLLFLPWSQTLFTHLCTLVQTFTTEEEDATFKSDSSLSQSNAS